MKRAARGSAGAGSRTADAGDHTIVFKFLHRTRKSENLDRKLVFALHAKKIPRLSTWKHLPKLLTSPERWIMRIALAVLLLTVSGTITRVASKHLIRLPRSGGSYVEGLVGVPRFINPIMASTDVDRDLARLIYSGLLRYTDSGQLTEDLASRIEHSADEKILTLRLKENLHFHDEKPLTSEDVAFTISAIQNPAWRSPLWRAFQDIAVQTPDPQTVIITTKAPTPALLRIFTVGILPKHIWENVDPINADRAVWNLKPVGSGPFQFKSLSKTGDGILSALKLVRNDTFHFGAPYLDEITLRFFPGFDEALQALKEHTIQGVSFIPARLANNIPAKGFAMRSLAMPHYTAVFFQDRNNAVFREVSVRRALALALDRKAISQTVPGGILTDGPFFPGQIGFASTLAPITYDPQKATLLLESAGWKKKGVVWVKTGKELGLTLTVLNEPTFLAVAQKIKQDWEALGIQVTLEIAQKETLIKNGLRPRAYEALLFSIVGGEADPYPLWHSSQMDDPGLNLSSVKVREIDSLLETGRRTFDQTVRAHTYIEFQKRLQEAVPAILLYRSPYTYVVSSKVHGLTRQTLTTPSDRLIGIEKWFVRSRLGWK